MQYPSVVFFIGKNTKIKALRALYPQNAISNRRKFGIANICVDSTTENDEHPVLLAECCPDYTHTKPRGGTETCHDTTSHSIAWPNGGTERQELIDHVQARLLSLFMDVLCLFACDYGGLDAVAERLISWASIGSASTLPRAIRPRLLIVSNISGSDFDSEVLRFRLRVLSHSGFSESFSSLKVVNVLRASRCSPREHFSALGQVLNEEIRLQRVERVNMHTLFSMVHTAAFFDLALQQFAASPRGTFDFISTSREDFPISPSFPHHLKSFMDVCAENRVPDHIAFEFIASVVIMDAFPPDMHSQCPFHHQRVAVMLTENSV
jgi:hypothetical protein